MTEVTKVYLLSGDSSNMSDYCSWYVGAFLEEAKAKDFLEKLENITKENPIPQKLPEDPWDSYYPRYKQAKEKLTVLLHEAGDICADIQNDEVSYHIQAVPIR